MNILYSLVILCISLSVVSSTCWHGNVMMGGYNHDIAVSTSSNGTFSVVFGEVPRWLSQYIFLYSGTTSYTSNNVWTSYSWPSGLRMMDVFPSLTMTNATVQLIGSGVQSYIPSTNMGIALIPRASINSTTLISSLLPDMYIFGINLRDELIVPDYVCSDVGKYLQVSRYTIYNNWRYARYSSIIALCLVVMIIMYYSYPNRITEDRLFRSCTCIILGILYGVLGIIFISSTSMDFQSIEYVYYMFISVVYFGGFIRYLFRKILQDKTLGFYRNIITNGNIGLSALKDNMLEHKIYVNNNLNTLVSKIPRSFSNSIILWVGFILSMPGIEIISYDALNIVPYGNFVLSITIAKFIVPIATALLPSLLVFLWSIYDYVKRDRKRKLGNYFGLSEDPLLYRVEFLSCIILCLPTAVITFIVGNLDSVIPSYILTSRWYLLSFHALFYIAFDLSYLIVVSGAVSIVISKIVTMRHRPDDLLSETTVSKVERKKVSRKELALKLMMEDKDMHEFLRNYATRTNNYIAFGLREWLKNINLSSSDADQTIKTLMGYYITSPLIGHCISNCIHPRGLGTYDEIVGYTDIPGFLLDLIDNIDSVLFKGLIVDGVEYTEEYQEYVKLNKIHIEKKDEKKELEEILDMDRMSGQGDDMSNEIDMDSV